MRPVVDATVPRYLPADNAALNDARLGPSTLAWHDACAARVPALAALEVVPPPSVGPLEPVLRIAAWNAERLKYAQPSAALIASTRADIVLLSEVDIGMARSGNRHTVRELAQALEAGFVYGVEFVELGLGDEREALWHAGQTNEGSYHGNAVVAPLMLVDPCLIPLDAGGLWFAGEGDPAQRRLGGRNAIAARVPHWQRDLWVVSVHLENRADPATRAAQMRVLIAALDARVGDAAIVIGGDLNTNQLPSPAGAERMLPLESGDLSHALAELDSAEPLFGVMAAAGFDMANANQADITQRARPDGTPTRPYTRIDWMFTRGLKTSRPRTVAALDADEVAISDHDLVMIDIEPA